MSDQNFRKALDSTLHQPSGDLSDLLKELKQQLQRFAEEEGVPMLAARFKRLLRDQLNSGALLQAESLLQAFGAAIPGEDVGILGKDIIEPCLHHRSLGIRNAALLCLDGWLHSSGEATILWMSLLAEHLAREVDPALLKLCQTLLGIPEEEFLDSEIEEELRPWAECVQATKNQAVASLVSAQVPPFLERCVGLHPATTIDLIESAKTGVKPTRSYNLNIHLTRSEPELGYVVRVWTISWACLLQRVEDDRWRVTVGF